MPLLAMPLKPQWGPGANRYINDCGPACVAMVLDFYGKLGALTVDTLAAETGLRLSDSGLLPGGLRDLAYAHGLRMLARAGVSPTDLRTEIDAGRPVIALVAYRFILGRLDQGDNIPGNDGHYVVIVGYDEEHYVLDDPDYWTPYTEQGHDVLVPVGQLERAMSSTGGQCVVMELPVSINDQIIALAKQIEALAAQVPDPTPLPEPSEAFEEVLVKSDKTNIRAAPTTKAGVIAVVRAGTALNVVNTNITATDHVWYKIFDGAYVGGYIAQDVVVPKA